MTQYHSRQLLRAGFVLFLLGLLTGFFIPLFANPRMGLAGHLQGVLNGLLLVGLGLAWPRLNLKRWQYRWVMALACYGTYANWLATTMAAAWGAGSMMPLAAPGYSAAPWQEQVVGILLLSLSLAMVLAICGVVYGLRTTTTLPKQTDAEPSLP